MRMIGGAACCPRMRAPAHGGPPGAPRARARPGRARRRSRPRARRAPRRTGSAPPGRLRGAVQGRVRGAEAGAATSCLFFLRTFRTLCHHLHVMMHIVRLQCFGGDMGDRAAGPEPAAPVAARHRRALRWPSSRRQRASAATSAPCASSAGSASALRNSAAARSAAAARAASSPLYRPSWGAADMVWLQMCLMGFGMQCKGFC